MRKSFLQEHRAFGHIPNHVLHTILVLLQLDAVAPQIVQLSIGQATAGSIGCQVFEDTEGDVIQLGLGKVLFQVINAFDRGPIR